MILMHRAECFVGVAGRAAGLLLMALVAAGCSRGPTLVPAGGTVKLDGQPLAGATVTFVPQQAGRPATGTTDEQGTFRLATAQAGQGAAPGPYTVTVMLARYQNVPARSAAEGEEADTTSGSGGPVPQVEIVVPIRYNSPASSGLTATVAPGAEPFVFELTTASQP
jgi:hypothetical protein